VHVVDEGSAIAGSLEPGIDLVVARYGGFLLSSKKWKVRVAVMDNIVPVMVVSRSVSDKARKQRTILQCHFPHARTASSRVGCAFLPVALVYPMQLSGCGRGSVPHNSGTVGLGGGGK
jgi:hypothetical protein